MQPIYRRNFITALIGDGRPLLSVGGLILVLCGAFALFLSATGHFLPHDISFLGIMADVLCGVDQCRVVHFMFHDRVSFGGALIAIGSIYLWMAEFPLRNGEPWAWWALAVSGLIGFGSFLTYLGYGYLDSWHGAATLLLFPCFLIGAQRCWSRMADPKSPAVLLRPSSTVSWFSRYGCGRACLIAVAGGMIFGGLTIMYVGMTRVFVPQDLKFLRVTPAALQVLNPRLIPLIAHDRAGFGGAVCCCGSLVLFLTWCGKPSRALWQVLLIAGTAGFTTAIGIHPLIGYTDFMHLAPAVLGAIVFVVGMVLLKAPMYSADVAGNAIEPDNIIRTSAKAV